MGPPMDPYKDLNNVNISSEICVNVFQLIKHVNISLVIDVILSGIGNMCKPSMGPPMNPYKDHKNVNISFEICVNVLQRAVHGSL